MQEISSVSVVVVVVVVVVVGRGAAAGAGCAEDGCEDNFLLSGMV